MKYPELKWVVLCQWRNKSYWEPMAAFNCKEAALSYKYECEDVNSDYLTYKIEEITDA